MTNFLGHDVFNKRFMKDFSKTARLMCKLFEKDMKFVFDEKSLLAIKMLKQKFIEASILIAPNWELPVELICDASDITVGQFLSRERTIY